MTYIPATVFESDNVWMFSEFQDGIHRKFHTGIRWNIVKYDGYWWGVRYLVNKYKNKWINSYETIHLIRLWQKKGQVSDIII